MPHGLKNGPGAVEHAEAGSRVCMFSIGALQLRVPIHKQTFQLVVVLLHDISTMRHSPPMHGNGPADAPRISNTPRVGHNWAVGASESLGRSCASGSGPAAACARNRVPAANAEVASAAYGWSGPQRSPPRTPPLRGRLRPGYMHERFAERLR